MKKVLARTQENELFALIQQAGLQPADFAWSLELERPMTTTHEKVLHRPTGSLFEFSLHTDGQYWLVFWPNHRGGSNHGFYRSWASARQRFGEWLQDVRRDHEAPDLWGAIRQVQDLVEPNADAEHLKPFSNEELKKLDAGLDDVERFITTTQPLAPDGQEEVKRRFAYLREAARKTARKVDWTNIFVGQIMQMFANGLLDPKFYQPVLQHAATALNALFQFGTKLLGP